MISYHRYKIRKETLALAILTLVTVLVWMGVEIYHAFSTSDIPKVLQRQTAPLNPNIDPAVWTSLESRYLPDFANNPLPLTVPEVAEVEVGGESAIEASPTGSLQEP